jgi:hypothetical protein
VVSVTAPVKKPEIVFDSSESEVLKGRKVELQWDATNVKSCVLTGPELEVSGKKGLVETDALERTTRYALSCVSLSGEQIEKEVEVRVVKKATPVTRQETEFTDPLQDY